VNGLEKSIPSQTRESTMLSDFVSLIQRKIGLNSKTTDPMALDSEHQDNTVIMAIAFDVTKPSIK
jgi:hypothetical protein